MSAAHTESSGSGGLRVGVVAVAERLEALHAAAVACGQFTIVAQAGMRPAEAIRPIPRFEDFRVLLTDAGPQALLIDLPPRAAADVIDAATERGVHVWQLPPLARSFGEAAELVAKLRKREGVLRAGSWWEQCADESWREAAFPEHFVPLFSEIRVGLPGPPVQSWRSSASDAAGGVLADGAYPLLEALIVVRGLPHLASASVGRFRKFAAGAARETEDTAVATLRYEDGGFVFLRAAWDMPPAELITLHHGASASVALSDHEIAVLDAGGVALDRRPVAGDYLAADMLRFAEWIRSPSRDRAAALLDRHLAVSALLEAIYLAARTGQPESPRKLYEVQGWPVPRP